MLCAGVECVKRCFPGMGRADPPNEGAYSAGLPSSGASQRPSTPVNLRQFAQAGHAALRQAHGERSCVSRAALCGLPSAAMDQGAGNQ